MSSFGRLKIRNDACARLLAARVWLQEDVRGVAPRSRVVAGVPRKASNESDWIMIPNAPKELAVSRMIVFFFKPSG